MFFLYDSALLIATFFIKIAAFFNKKIALFYRGRQGVFQRLSDDLIKNKNTIWIHAASLGEYEQGLPVVKKLIQDYPHYQILVTFFSPSGYEIISKKEVPFAVSYLPLDRKKNVIQFIDIVQPKIALFVKYEIWPNFFRILDERDIPLFIISARFNRQQAFFKSYGGILRKSLNRVNHFFVQDVNSANLLKELGHTNSTITGDTRFDRVQELRGFHDAIPHLDSFCKKNLIVVAGSTWPADEEVLFPFINGRTEAVKFIIAPHNIDQPHIASIKSGIKKKSINYSQATPEELSEAEVLIIDTIGILSKIYRYGDIAYVGGGFATGLHNTLEPAVYGIPILIGPKFGEFNEAKDLVALGGIRPVINAEELRIELRALLSDNDLRSKMGLINKNYIDKNTGASVQIVNYLRTYL